MTTRRPDPGRPGAACPVRSGRLSSECGRPSLRSIPMTPKRPTGVSVVAILNIILGSFGLLGGLCMLTVMPAIQSALQQPAGANNAPNIGKMIEDETQREDPNHKTVTTTQMVL